MMPRIIHPYRYVIKYPQDIVTAWDSLIGNDHPAEFIPGNAFRIRHHKQGADSCCRYDIFLNGPAPVDAELPVRGADSVRRSE
jgi:hypothetical protein